MARWCGFVALVVFLTSGCGGGMSTGTINGKITKDGKPVSAIVTVTAENNMVFTGKTDESGNYTVKDVPVGKAKVAINDRAADGASGSAEALDPKVDPKGKPGAAPAVGQPTAVPNVVPQKYKKPETSGLTVTVTAGLVEFPIDLKP